MKTKKSRLKREWSNTKQQNRGDFKPKKNIQTRSRHFFHGSDEEGRKKDGETQSSVLQTEPRENLFSLTLRREMQRPPPRSQTPGISQSFFESITRAEQTSSGLHNNTYPYLLSGISIPVAHAEFMGMGGGLGPGWGGPRVRTRATPSRIQWEGCRSVARSASHTRPTPAAFRRPGVGGVPSPPPRWRGGGVWWGEGLNPFSPPPPPSRREGGVLSMGRGRPRTRGSGKCCEGGCGPPPSRTAGSVGVDCLMGCEEGRGSSQYHWGY